MTEHDPVNHPTHYASDAKCDGCGTSIECIEIVRHLPFARGNAIKYLWRAGKKGATVEDLKKAVWYIQDEISQLEGVPNPNVHRLSEPKPVCEFNVQYSLESNTRFCRIHGTFEGFEQGLRDQTLPLECPAVRANPAVSVGRVIGKITSVEEDATGLHVTAELDEPKCSFNEAVVIGHAYRFDCVVHNFGMIMPIDKAPEFCDKGAKYVG